MRAAERELAEELGLAGRATAYIGAWMDVYGDAAPDGIRLHCVTSAYLVELEVPEAEPRPDPAEATGSGWFSLEALPDELAFPDHARPMLAAAAALIAGTAPPLPDRVW
jgi:ADP-ribose pyrophosphatase YjhB (NUDIX family)